VVVVRSRSRNHRVGCARSTVVSRQSEDWDRCFVDVDRTSRTDFDVAGMDPRSGRYCSSPSLEISASIICFTRKP
jgi:hypothetical protein